MSLLTPDYNHCTLIIIDFQNDFVLPGAPSEIVGSYAILPALQQLITTARDCNMPIIHVVRYYLPDGSNVDLCRREKIQTGAVLIPPNSEGADFPQVLKPAQAPTLDWGLLLQGQLQQLGPQEWVMYKSRWGAFYQTNLEDFLHHMQINTLIFAGCNFPNCPRTSIYEASERDFRLILPQDAMSKLCTQGIQELKNIGVVITDTNTLCQELRL